MIIRRKSKAIRIGEVTIGGNAPVVVQSMAKTDTRDIRATVNQINELAECGCEIARVAVPDVEAAQAISTIKKKTTIPIIADIHFDYRLALESLKAGANGLRLNPGNIQAREQVAEVVKAARQRQVPIRIGVNAGSLPHLSKPSTSTSEHMVNVALEQIRLLESLDFDLIKVSLKAFDVLTTIEAYRGIASKISYPLHLGITEAGLPKAGAVRSAVGIGILLNEGIGDTIRVSLSAHPCEEVVTAFEILKALGFRQHGPTLISCPSCGRAEVDIISLAESVDRSLRDISKPIKVAVMGCVVNGPGEAKEADVGIACGKSKGAIFRKGKVVSTVNEKNFLEALMAEVKNILN
ncbi:MAG: flavodoxin-dependent (E)-4-hydroxy-3-methylbut-2-enyl-diphosphate synthase [Dehalococcoidia bacterium]|nr:flavodoxin-dependent (E)-4-hydroxy-3-methylbut-2-enyl-diphosphate synthase [Dehalococcoidia bacterium]